MQYASYSELSATYGGFLAPAMKVLVNDSVLSLILSALGVIKGGTYLTDGISITLNKDAASSATFNLIGDYNATLRSFQRRVQTGAKLCILLGYGSALKPVFVGYVDSVNYEFSETPKVTVTAFDAIKLMMDGGEVERTWSDGKFYLDTIAKIMWDYADICPLPVTNMLPTLRRHGQLCQKSNSYDYVKNYLCKYCDRDLILKGGFAHLVHPDFQFGKLTDLGFGEGITSFSVQSGYKKVKAIVTGDQLSQAYGESTVMTGYSYKKSMNRPQEMKVEAPLKTSSDCKLYANRLAKDAIREAQTAKGTCIGIPDIVPGVGLGIQGIDAAWDGKTYFVDTATHTLNASGYTTAFTTKGWS